MRLGVLGLGVALALLTFAAPLGATGPGEAAEVPLALRPAGTSPSISMGRPHRGLLRRGVRLDDTTNLLVKENSEEARYGTAELVRMLYEAADAVASAYPGSRLLVGDLSQRGGGRRRPHVSHRTGRDADVGFYVRDEAGSRVRVPVFFGMSRSGWGRHDTVRYRFDVARNWTLLAALLTSAQAEVQQVFVANGLRRLLLREARAQGASEDLYARARTIVRQPSYGKPHRTHFHVRIYCPSDDVPECVDGAPLWPWHPTATSTR